jgi:EAL domain-containing protein (putative c-di-GMP-specific phosphodiesterase class I)/ActR/RegA family two-component response regulator
VLNRPRALIVSANDALREKLIDEAVRLHLSVTAIRLSEELPLILRSDKFEWAILDLEADEEARLAIIRTLSRSRQSALAGIVLVSQDEIVLAQARAIAVAHGLKVVGFLSRAFSPTALGTALGRRVRGRTGRATARPGTIFGRRKSIPAGQIVIHYQPVIGIEDRSIRGVEALVRWRHPRHGLLKPDSFIAEAERSGAIVALTWHVLEKVVRQQVAWQARGVPLAVAVNISALFLASLERADEILELLRREGFDPRRLTLEITETEAARNPPVARALLSKLRSAGVTVSMDDYGMGFSNLERMRLLPFDDLKIDRWLVARLEYSREARRTVEMLVALAAEQKFSVTGEGIETEQQWHALKELGCHFGQGYLIAHPMPGDRVRGWIGKMMEAGRYHSQCAC